MHQKPLPYLAILATLTSFAVNAGPAGKKPFTWSNPIYFQYTEGQTAPLQELRDPCIIRAGDTYYLVFTMWPFTHWIKDEYNRDGKMGYVAFVGVADKVTGPYKHISWLKGGGCDTSLFGDDDGKTYAIMPFGQRNISRKPT
jgi:beta-xylosidase